MTAARKMLVGSISDRHTEITPEVRGGRPCIVGTRIMVADIVILHLSLGQSLEEIAGSIEDD